MGWRMRRYLDPACARYAAQRLVRGWSAADADEASAYWSRVIAEMLEHQGRRRPPVPFDAASGRPYPAGWWAAVVAFIAHALRQERRVRADPAFAVRLTPADRDAIRADWATAMGLLVAHWGHFHG